MFENVKETPPLNPSPNFVHNFFLKAQNHKQILADESELEFPDFFSSKFFQKSYSTMTNWPPKSVEFRKHFTINE